MTRNRRAAQPPDHVRSAKARRRSADPAGRRARARRPARLARARSRCGGCAPAAGARRRRRSPRPRRRRSLRASPAGGRGTTATRNAPVSRTSTPASSAVSGDFPPGVLGGHRLARAAGLHEARREAGERVRSRRSRRAPGSGRSGSRPWTRGRARRPRPRRSGPSRRTRRARRLTRSSIETSGTAGSGSPRGSLPTRSTPRSSSPSTAASTIDDASTISVPGSCGASRRNATNATTLAAPAAAVHQWMSSRWPPRSPSWSKNWPLPAGTPSSFGAWPRMIVRPRPNRKPPITGLDTKSERLPSPSTPPAASTTAVTSASAADSVAKRAVSPCASSPTADAESAEVAVVALTISVREEPRNAYAIIAPGRRHQPGLRREARDLRVRDGLRHDDAPHDHSRDRIRHEPDAPVPAEPSGNELHGWSANTVAQSRLTLTTVKSCASASSAPAV